MYWQRPSTHGVPGDGSAPVRDLTATSLREMPALRVLFGLTPTWVAAT
jgi:hypothetical protein